jgi:non-specific serine/threonine protein kinase
MSVHYPTSFIGRAEEVATVLRLLRANRLLTLTGPGGAGKTRLALAVTDIASAQFPGDIHIVSLAAVSDPALVVPAISTALQVHSASDDAALAGIIAFLRERRVLLVLDNFEQVVDAALIVADLLTQCPTLTILVTSRIPLHLAGEQEYPVPPLALPDPDARIELDTLNRSDAVALFTRRAQQSKPDFALAADNAAVVVDICRRLDGLPLALELAAARIKLLAPQALLIRLDRRLVLLTGGSRDAPSRQRTMRDTIAWSYDLLTTDEQRLFRQLAVFAGGWTLDAAAAVCRGDGDLFDGIARLVDHSLVHQMEQLGDAARFGMLETIREYGLEQLEQHGEIAEARQRHARFFLDLVARAEPHLGGHDQQRWLNILEKEHANVRAALGWATEHDVEAALISSADLWLFWLYRVHLYEGRRWVEAALAVGDTSPARVRAKALDVAGSMASWQGDFVAANRYFEASLCISRELGDRWNVANTLRGMGRLAMAAGDFARADRLGIESVTIFEDLDETSGLMLALGNLGWNTLGTGDLARGRELLQQGLDLARYHGNVAMVANYLAGLAFVTLDQGDADRALQMFAETLVQCRDIHDLRFIALCFEGFGRIAGRQGKSERAARLIGAATSLRDQIGMSEVEAFLSPQLDRDLTAVRADLAEDAFTSAWNAGQRMSIENAILFAFDAASVIASRDTAQPSIGTGLSPRELEVLRLIAAGKSNREIAEALFLSLRTVERHIANIYLKIDVHNRAEAAAYAQRRRLV